MTNNESSNSEPYPFDKSYRLGGGFLSPSGHALYINIPKNASTSLQRQLLPLGFRYTTAFRSRPVPPGVTVFAVIREPLGRWVSAMLEFDKSDAQPLPFARFAAEQLARLRAGTYRPLDPHLTPQSTFLLPTMPVTAWLRFDRLAEDYAALAARLDLPARMRHANRGLSARAALLTGMLTDHDRRLVRDYYATDAARYDAVVAAGGPDPAASLTPARQPGLPAR